MSQEVQEQIKKLRRLEELTEKWNELSTHLGPNAASILFGEVEEYVALAGAFKRGEF